MTGLILHERTNLRRITLRPCGIWFTVWATDAESYTHGLILQLLQNSPQLVDLSLSGYCGQFVVFLQTLVEFCPLVETINYEGHSRVSAEVVAMTGSLSHLREFRLKEYCEEINEVERQLIPNFLRRSSATLEVISVQLDYNANYFDTKTAVWTFWPECPRLREYIFVLDWIHGVIVPDDYLIDTVVELLSRPTVACWNLQKLGLLITDHKSNEECARHSYKSWGQDTYDHQQNFLQSIQPLYSCLRSFKRLRQDNLFITWNICASTSMMSLDMVLPRINGHPILALDTQPPGPAHTRGSSSSSSGGSESELPQRKEPAITRRELDWIGLGRRWLSGTEKQEQTEKIARTRNLRDGELSHPLAYSASPSNLHHQQTKNHTPAKLVSLQALRQEQVGFSCLHPCLYSCLTPASTPTQTPRASMLAIRDSSIKMTPEEALYKISKNMMTNVST
ncbi:hypothetical protein BGZ95_005493, partial [Linnemannia exigua]